MPLLACPSARPTLYLPIRDTMPRPSALTSPNGISRLSSPVDQTAVKIEHDRELYKRNRIERMFGHLKINRAIATRYDQLANSFLGMVHLATARYWLKFVHAA